MSDFNTFIVLCSGKGSNLRSILEAAKNNELLGRPLALISSSDSALALNVAAEYNLPAFSLNGSNKEDRENQLRDKISALSPDFIVLAGYIKLVPLAIVKQYSGKILNIHPSLLPKHGGKGMYGIKVHESVLNSKDKKTGATIHLVTENFDEGPIILQKEIEVYEDDTAESLSKRVFELEHQLYPQAINEFISSLKKSK